MQIFSLISAFSQKNKTYKKGLGVCVLCVFVCVCVCMYVCVCVSDYLKFWSLLTISKLFIRLVRNFGYISYRTETLQRH